MTLKVIHTSDWHLGKKLFKRTRVEEQSLFLNWLYEYLKSESIDVLLVCGDIFDTPTPPNDALKLYFDFLNKVSELKTELIIISGNHDSASFIQAPSDLLNKHNIHIKTKIDPIIENNIIELKHQCRNLEVKTLPYFRSYDIYNNIETQQTELSSNEIKEYLKEYMEKWIDDSEQRPFRIIMAHHAFGTYAATGSEHTLQLAGLDSLETTWINPNYDYMALGHIHSTQKVDPNKDAYYSGAPIPLRFSETQRKNILRIDLNNNQHHVSKIEIPTFRIVSQIKGNKEDILSKIDSKIQKDKELNCPLPAFYEVIITLDEPDNLFIDSIINLIDSSEAHLLSLVPVYKIAQHDEEITTQNINGLSIDDIFDEFYKLKHPDSKQMPKHILENFQKLMDEINHED